MVIFHNTFVNSPHMGAYVTAGQANLHYYEDGCGRPLVMLPPAGLSLFTFRKNIIPLADHARVAAVDLPGQGYAQCPDCADLSARAMADMLAEFLLRCELAPAVLCGAGEGAIYALETALRYPDMVQALILISPGSVTRRYPLSLRILDRPRLGELLMEQLDISIMARFL
ncbi:MAG: alpha/beta hydrolase, partial [Eubacteriales bacterium]|nr:alpha/beta hydrolase [Eubacteriales bacterium]